MFIKCSIIIFNILIQIGAISVTMSWLNLLSTLRKFPFLGIYVVMFTDVLQTFLKFSLIILLFIIAFSLGFHALIGEQVNIENSLNNLQLFFLLQNIYSFYLIRIFGFQKTFVTYYYAMMKTAVMMIGEFEYDAIFFEHDTHDDARRVLPYQSLTILFFLAFVIIMPIIIMNLLVRNMKK